MSRLYQARQRVFELRQFHLKPRFERPGARGEDVEDQLAAVEHLDAEGLFEVAALGGVEVVVEDDDVGDGAGAEFAERKAEAEDPHPWCDYAPPIDFPWPEYVETPRGREWWIPATGVDRAMERG